MTYSLHGFVKINNLIDNRYKEVSIIGELSEISKTFAIDKGYYTLTDNAKIQLISFRSKLNDNDNVPVPSFVIENCIELSTWISDQAQNGHFINVHDNVRQAINANWRNRLSDIRIGKLVKGNNSIYIPEWIEFSIKNDTQPNKIKLWFVDESFKQQYPYYEIAVFPPITGDLDVFFNDVNEVRDLHVKVTESGMKNVHDRINTYVLENKCPGTVIKTFDYEFIGGNGNRYLFPWTVVIHGSINENLDIIKESLIDYILKHSKHTRTDWERIFPDLFVPTEFIFAPFWNNYSIPNKQLIAGMFSPMVSLSEIEKHIKPVYPGYSMTHLKAFSQVGSNLYKSISFTVCGHVSNRLTTAKFTDKWPQYALVRSVSEDINRVSVDTQKLLRHLAELFHYSDEYQLNDNLPEHITKVDRNGIIYLAVNIDRIQYLMVTRYNYLEGKLKPSE